MPSNDLEATLEDKACCDYGSGRLPRSAAAFEAYRTSVTISAPNAADLEIV